VIPGSLRGRLIAAFAVLAIAILLTVGGALFLVLRGLHAEATQAGLADVADSVGPQVRQSVAAGDVRGTIVEIRDRLAARGIDVLLVNADGSLRALDGTASVGSIQIAADAATGAVVRGGTTIDGERQLFAATVLRGRGVLARALAFVVADRAGAQALGDLVRAIPAVVVIVLVIGAGLAWLASRSVTRPLGRLARAAAGLPDGPTGRAEPLPLEGPAEVRELTGTFNAMAGQLADLRSREGELLADLRHDLRTPLTVISGFAAALADGTATGEDAARAAKAIEEEAGRLERLVAELGAIERLRSGAAGLRPEELEASTLLDDTRERFAATATAAGVELTIADGSADRARLRFAADRLAVERILANLVANALGAAPAGGHVWLDARPVAGAADAPAVALSVTDDGPGFPPGTAGRAFERFYRADPSRSGGGSGLGLAIVQELAAAHGGTAHAENVAPHGARVSVVLPIVPRV
jgi:signal transduction histidine kinase